MALVQQRLVVEKIDLRRPALNEEIITRFAPSAENGAVPPAAAIRCAGGAREHVRERDSAESHAEVVEELAAVERIRFIKRVAANSGSALVPKLVRRPAETNFKRRPNQIQRITSNPRLKKSAKRTPSPALGTSALPGNCDPRLLVSCQRFTMQASWFTGFARAWWQRRLRARGCWPQVLCRTVREQRGGLRRLRLNGRAVRGKAAA